MSRAQNHPPLPLMVLGGADDRPAELPEAGAGLHPLHGPKGVQLEIGGRPIIDLLLDRLWASGEFDPIFIGGPVSAYGESRGRAQVVDTDGTFGENIATTFRHVMQTCPGGPIAITTCDILPEVHELSELMADYRSHAPLDLWFPLVEAPPDREQLGASRWKPQYRMIPDGGTEPKSMLPGHLLVTDPESMRTPLILNAFELAYRTRNRPIFYRLLYMLPRVFLGLVGRDLRHLLALRLPTMTATVFWHAIAMSRHLRAGIITQRELEDRLRGIFVRHRHRKRHPDRRGRMPLVKALSLAKDIDTQEEADEQQRELS